MFARNLIVCGLSIFVVAMSGGCWKVKSSGPPKLPDKIPEPVAVDSKLDSGLYVSYRHWESGLKVLIVDDIQNSRSRSVNSALERAWYKTQGFINSTRMGETLVHWVLTTDDGVNGKFSINKTKYDLSNGAVFKIWTDGKKVNVQQYQLDMDALLPSKPSCRKFIEKNL